MPYAVGQKLKLSLIAAVAFIIFPLAAAQSAPQCVMRDASGVFTVSQSNKFEPKFNLTQSGRQVTGSASYEKGPAGFVTKGNVVAGRSFITGTDFTVVIQWDNKTRGAYKGTFDSSGHLSGTTTDEQHPAASGASFSVNDRVFACLKQSGR